MLRYVRIPLLFLFIGSLLGLLLRWQFIAPTPGINYSNFLHAHSHIMFLGWVFNALYLALCENHLPEIHKAYFRKLFLLLQLTVVGMLIAFPLQGYALYSILFSTLHTLLVFVFIYQFLVKTKHATSVSAWFARTALIFFAISSAGPFSLGYLMANGLGQSNWYNFSIYFYLHFQYNGFFLFGVLSVFFSLLEKKQIQFSLAKAKTFGWITAATCVPAYLLSVLWAKPGIIFNVVSGATAVIQLGGFFVLLRLVFACLPEIKTRFARLSRFLLASILLALFLKLTLQACSALPQIAQMAYELRPIVIAYLHMVLIGIISMSLLVWYVECAFIKGTSATVALSVFAAAFVGMEICLVTSPWWSILLGNGFYSFSATILVFSVLLSISCFLLLSSQKKLTKISQ